MSGQPEDRDRDESEPPELRPHGAEALLRRAERVMTHLGISDSVGPAWVQAEVSAHVRYGSNRWAPRTSNAWSSNSRTSRPRDHR